MFRPFGKRLATNGRGLALILQDQPGPRGLCTRAGGTSLDVFTFHGFLQAPARPSTLVTGGIRLALSSVTLDLTAYDLASTRPRRERLRHRKALQIDGQLTEVIQ